MSLARTREQGAEERPFPYPSRLRRLLARSRETRVTRPNRRACSQAIFYSLHEQHVQCMQIYRKLVFHMQIVQKILQKSNLCEALPKRELKNIMVFFALANLELYKLTPTLPCLVLEIAAETRSWQPVWRSGKKERWRNITIQGADHQAKWDVFDWERIQRFSEEKTVNTETILQER